MLATASPVSFPARSLPYDCALRRPEREGGGIDPAAGAAIFQPMEHVVLTIEIDRETDGRWIAEIPELPGVMVYGDTQGDAVNKVEALAFAVLSERLRHGEPVPAAACEVFAFA